MLSFCPLSSKEGTDVESLQTGGCEQRGMLALWPRSEDAKMLSLADANRTRQRWLAAMFLGSLILLAWVPWRSSARPESRLACAPAVVTQNLMASEPLAAGAAGDESQALAAACVPSIDLLPGQDGTELFIGISGLDESCGTVCVNTNKEPGIWPVHDQRCCTMSPCVITVSGFTPHTSESGFINVTSTLGSNAPRQK